MINSRNLSKLAKIIIPSRVYEYSSLHCFNEGDFIILKQRNTLFGIRPLGIINCFLNNELITRSSKGLEIINTGFYDITLNFDLEGNKNRWVKYNEYLLGVQRDIKRSNFAKIDIEDNFKRINVNSLDEALKSYNSIGVSIDFYKYLKYS